MIRRTFITFVMLSGLLSAFVYTLLIAYNTSVLFVGGRQVALVGPPVLATQRDYQFSPVKPGIFAGKLQRQSLEFIKLQRFQSPEQRIPKDTVQFLQTTRKQQKDEQQMLADPIQQLLVVPHHHLPPKQRHHWRHLLQRHRRQHITDKEQFITSPSKSADFSDQDVKALPPSQFSSLQFPTQSKTQTLPSSSSFLSESARQLNQQTFNLPSYEGLPRLFERNRPIRGVFNEQVPAGAIRVPKEQSVPKHIPKRQKIANQQNIEPLQQTDSQGRIANQGTVLQYVFDVQASRSHAGTESDQAKRNEPKHLTHSKHSDSSSSSSSSSFSSSSSSSSSLDFNLSSLPLSPSTPSSTSSTNHSSLSQSLPLRPPSTLLLSPGLVGKLANVADAGDSDFSADRTGVEDDDSIYEHRSNRLALPIRERLKTDAKQQQVSIEPGTLNGHISTADNKVISDIERPMYIDLKGEESSIKTYSTNGKADTSNKSHRDRMKDQNVQFSAAGESYLYRDDNTIIKSFGANRDLIDGEGFGRVDSEDEEVDENYDENTIDVENMVDGEETADGLGTETFRTNVDNIGEAFGNRVSNEAEDDEDNDDRPLSQFHMMPVLPKSSKIVTLREGASKKLPQAIIIGVKKGGTRALLEFLRLHPDIRAPGPEPHFFDRNYNKGLEWYRSKMPATIEGQISMEKTPSYFVTKDVPRRIYNMSKKVKLIVVVRDPVTRSISDYTQTMSKRRSVRPFEQMVFVNNSTRIVDTSWGAIRIGVYAKHLELWLKYFPLSQMHFVSGEKLITDPAGEMALLQDFLGLKRVINEKHFFFNETKGFPCLKKPEGSGHPHCLGKTKGRQHPKIDPKVIQRLRDFYRPFNAKFYEMAHRDFEWP